MPPATSQSKRSPPWAKITTVAGTGSLLPLCPLGPCFQCNFLFVKGAHVTPLLQTSLVSQSTTQTPYNWALQPLTSSPASSFPSPASSHIGSVAVSVPCSTVPMNILGVHSLTSFRFLSKAPLGRKAFPDPPACKTEPRVPAGFTSSFQGSVSHHRRSVYILSLSCFLTPFWLEPKYPAGKDCVLFSSLFSIIRIVLDQ